MHDRLGASEHDRLGARAQPPRREHGRESTTASVREHDRLGATERSAIQSYKSVVCVFVYFLLIEFINVYKRLLSLFTSSAAPTESVHKQRVYERFIYYRLQFEVCKHRSLWIWVRASRRGLGERMPQVGECGLDRSSGF